MWWWWCPRLLKRGAKKDAKDNKGWTPLHLAASNGHVRHLEGQGS